MNKIILTSLLLTSLFLCNQFSNAQCHLNDWTALKALYESTNGDNWFFRDGWDDIIVNQSSPPDNCDLSGLAGINLDNDGRVSDVFTNNDLQGIIPPEIGILDNLKYLQLNGKSLTGSIPPEIGQLSNLEVLVLDGTGLSGSIPPVIGQLNNLTMLFLQDNELSGSIPPEIGNLTNLAELVLGVNNLSGLIPPEIGSLSNLKTLFLYENQLTGAIPLEIGNLDNLLYLDLFDNQLTGAIPSGIGNLSNLLHLTLANNELSGCYAHELIHLCDQLSSELVLISGLTVDAISADNNFDYTWEDFCATGNGGCILPQQGCPQTDSLALVALHQSLNGDLWDFNTRMNTWQGVKLNERGCVDELELIWVFGKNSSGFLPKEIGDLAEVTSILLSNNNISGTIPTEIGNLTNLKRLFLNDNKLEGEIPATIGNLTQLEDLNLYYNQFLTAIPSTIGSLTNLEKLYLPHNQIVDIPESIGNLVNLKELSLGFNQIKAIPESIGNLTMLTYFEIGGNQISSIPESIVNLKQLVTLGLGSNQISSIPPGFNNFTQLRSLNLGANQISSIPESIATLTQLKTLGLGGNQISSFPPDFSNLTQLEHLYLGTNNLTTFPNSIEHMDNLVALDLNDNQLTGQLPLWLSNKTQLEQIRIQNNNLSGCYADELQQLCNQLHFGFNRNMFISLGNSFYAPWEDFCATGAGSCSLPPPSCFKTDSIALNALNSSISVLGWDASKPVNSWPGVTLNQTGCVTGIVLDNAASGVIPPEIGDFEALEILTISNNPGVSGDIPDEIGNLTNLKELTISNTGISGEIPSSLGLLDLQMLFLNDNNLTGSMPRFLANFQSLFMLSLKNNQLSGCYDDELSFFCDFIRLGPFNSNQEISDGNNFDATWEDFCNLGNGSCATTCHIDDWTALKALYDSTNGDNWNNRAGWEEHIADQSDLSVDCDLSKLAGISLNDVGRVNSIFLLANNLQGILPTEIGQLSGLTGLFLNLNSLTGSIPPEIGRLSSLKDLVLEYNKLNGSIPPEIGNLTNLVELHLGENMLIGAIPPEISNLSNLEKLTLYKNQLTGAIPKSIANLSNLSQLILAYNQLNGCYAHELRQLCNQIPSEFLFIPPYPIDPISEGNNFNVTWEDFCQSNLGACQQSDLPLPPAGVSSAIYTNYSGNVEVSATLNENGEYELRNDYVKLIDYATCNTIHPDNCEPVTGFDDYAANEVFWATEKAALYFQNKYDIELESVVSLVNGKYQNEPNRSVFKKDSNVIIYGAGDSIERKTMTAPDIVGHEYMHYVINSTSNLLNYGETGALNESFADIFGEILEYQCSIDKEGIEIAGNDWVFGKQVTIGKSGIRSLSNPKDTSMYNQLPDTYAGDFWVNQDESCLPIDFCGIHTNNGVQNYWFYLLANGGEGINDNGTPYNIEGIGFDKAARIAFINLFDYLPRDAVYIDAVYGSINAAKARFGEFEAEQTTKAWEAVGLDTANPIKWKTKNSKRGQRINDDMPISFDLVIDSLGLDLSTDNLNFTLHIPPNYRNMKIGSIYEPLTSEDVVSIPNADTSEIAISINLQNLQFNKKARVKRLISSGSRIVNVFGCLVVEDISDECIKIPPMRISGGTIINEDNTENFETATLLFAPSCIWEEYVSNADSTGNIPASENYILNVALNLKNKNCSKLGALEVEVLNEESNDFDVNSNYYYLYDNSGVLIENLTATSSLKHHFYNLDEGSYQLVVEALGGYFIKNFEVGFVTSASGNYCCSGEITIPQGVVEGNFTALDTISFESGTTVKSGDFEICE